LEYEILRQRRKSVRIFVEEDRVVVKAPWYLPKRIIDAFVKSHQDYIQRLIAPLEEFFYLGQKIKIEPIRHGWRMEGEIFYSDEDRRKNVESFLQKEAQAYIPKRVQELAKAFGDRYTRVGITGAKSRWGSCSSKGHLNFTWRLMTLPPDLIEYVIVHELCHLSYMNHSRAFWDLVRSRMPDYQQRRKRLKEYSTLF